MNVHLRAIALGVALALGPDSVTWAGPGGDGTDTIGLYNPANSKFFLRNSNNAGQPDAGNFAFSVGVAGVTPLTGDWDSL